MDTDPQSPLALQAMYTKGVHEPPYDGIAWNGVRLLAYAAMVHGNPSRARREIAPGRLIESYTYTSAFRQAHFLLTTSNNVLDQRWHLDIFGRAGLLSVRAARSGMLGTEPLGTVGCMPDGRTSVQLPAGHATAPYSIGEIGQGQSERAAERIGQFVQKFLVRADFILPDGREMGLEA